jgi:phosphinothricin acetyltransferase
LGPSRFAQRIAHHRDAGDPVVVAVDGANAVVGYGSFGPFRPLAGYAATVEHSVFVADGHQGRGVGQRLLDELVARALAQGRRVMVAAVDGGNDGSIRFHRRNGFVEVGLMPGVGTKRGVARDLVLLQRDLSDDGHRSAP